ncbi:MAG: DUF1565 domain-containing protein, partial [Bacteroidota bacterium]|nr:DUF1565 domain-containing protein [Bacteroidota bacterium]
MKKYFLIIGLLIICNSSFSQVVKFAAFGDLGGFTFFPGISGDLEVSNLVKSWDTDTSFFIITLGDNNYFPSTDGASTIDDNIGQFYHNYIFPYNAGGFSPGYSNPPNTQTKNRFFRGLGNHDLYGNPFFHDFNYFRFTNVNYGNDLDIYPGGIRYYDFQKGNVHFFSYNSGFDPPNHDTYANVSERDGIDTGSVQGHWLKQRMLQSTAKWKIVYLHHPPYYSSDVVPLNENIVLRFPFKQWGANVVLSAHWHQYERLYIGGMTYVIAGLGGATHTNRNLLPQPIPGSKVLYSEAYGALQGNGYADSLVFKLINVDNQLIDYFKITDTLSILKTRFYVNDNTITGDVYTSTIGNNSNAGTSGAPFATINRAVAAANAGDTIYVDAGNYAENAVVNKRLTIIGSGNATRVNPPTGACFQYTAGGTRSILRQELKKIRLTSSGNGILINTPNLQYLTFNNVRSDNHTGNGIYLNTSWPISDLVDTSRRGDIRVDSCDLSNNANSGIRLGSNSNLDSLSITSGKIDSNGVQGFLSGENSSAGVTNVSITGTSFTRNGTTETGDQGDIIFSGFTGDATINNVIINSDAGYGIKFRSNSALSSAGKININNVNITGTAKNKIGLGFSNYAHLNSVSMNNNIINTNPSPAFTGFAIGVALDTIGSSVNLSGIHFGNTNLGNGAGIDIELAGSNNVNASSVTFSTANNYMIEDRIHHAIDVTGKGLVTWIPGNAYVTTNSFYLSFTFSPSIQRVINAVPNGFTINLGNGIYNEDININKTLEVTGESTAAIIKGLFAGDSSTILISANDINLRNVTITRNYGATISEWNASSKNQGIKVAQTTIGAVIQNAIITGNKNAILANGSQRVIIKSCTIENNYAGICFGNNFSESEVNNNFIRNNFTHGILFNYDLVPDVVVTNVNITNNSITGNWYSQVNFKRNSGPVSSGDHTGLTFSCNWYGTSTPSALPANAAEPAYTSLTPSQFGGTDPGLNRQLYGIEIIKCPYTPWLTRGTDNDLVAAGFQPVPDSCNGQPQARFYVNDSSITGDVYTSNVGNDINNGSSSAPFATINRAISAANAGDTIYVDAGTYGQNAVVNKRLIIIGSGNTTIVNPPSGACFQFTAGGTSSILRQVLKKVRLTASVDGILVSTTNLQYFTFNNVKSNLNSGSGINFNTTWSVSPADIRIDSCDLSDNNVGLKLASNSNLDSLTITSGQMNNNAVQGFLSGVSGSTGLTNVNITGTSFTGNGISEIGDQGDIIFLKFNGKATISNVNINSDAGYGIELRSNTPVAPAGNITLSNVNITGTAKNKFGIGFSNYTNLNSVSMSNVVINTNPSPTFSGFARGISLDTIGAAVNLSGISFGNTHLGNGAGIDIELAGSNNVNLSSVTFSTTDNFIIEDRIHHVIDVTGVGMVTWVVNNVYTTVNSFYTPTTTSASIQRGINAASNGFIVNVGNGTYNGDVNINKNLTVKGQSTAAIIRGLYAGDTNTVFISANNVTLRDVKVTRDYGANLAAWTASLKKQGIGIAQSTTGTVIQGVILTGNRNAILANNTQNVTITECIIEDNSNGIYFGNNFSGAEVHNNFIRNNFASGILFNYDLAGNVIATNVRVTNNSITGNWYSQVNFQRNSGSVPTGDHTGLSFNCNWYGTTAPTATAANAAEPAYTAQTPSQFGGTNPGLNRRLYGIEIAKCPYVPFLTNGSDSNLVAAGFQPVSSSCNGQPQTRYYVNDNSTSGDIYTSAVGNNANSGASSSPFATIAFALSVANANDTIFVDAGTYGENVVVNKRLIITGAGNTTIVNPPTGACFQFTAGGTSSVLRQVLKKVRLTASVDGILLSTTNLQYFTFNNVKSNLNSGSGINLNTTWSVSPADIKIDSCDLSDNNVGLRLGTNSNLDSLTITGGQMNSNVTQGFLSGAGSSAGVTNVNITGTSFTGNGSSEIGDQGDIIFLKFNGKATISNVNINADAGYGIELRSNTP